MLHALFMGFYLQFLYSVPQCLESKKVLKHGLLSLLDILFLGFNMVSGHC